MAKTQTGRLRALECPVCTTILYSSRGNVARNGYPSCACGQSMIFRHLDDHMEVAYDDGARHPDFAGMVRSAIGRAERERSSSNVWHACAGCQRRIGAVNERCGCGFENDIRGRRNHGRWSTGASHGTRAVDLPF